jgi:hypothetical protein
MMSRLRAASESKYQGALVAWLNTVYAEVLRFVDPAVAMDYEVRAAFRSYIPVKQQPRIVALFLGLYAAAGVGHNDPPKLFETMLDYCVPIGNAGSRDNAT